MNEAMAEYVRRLPLRWLLGGSILGVVWISPSVFEYVHSKGLQGLLPVLKVFATFVPPLGFLGFLWGWSERFQLERRIVSSGEPFDRATAGLITRQTFKGMICGAIFILFTFGTGFLLSFLPWDSQDHISSNLQEVFNGVLGGALVGAFVGLFARRSLQRKASPVV